MQTAIKTYTKKQIIQYFFKEGNYSDDSFIKVIGESGYRLIQANESELEKMLNAGKISDYITFDHVLSVISDNESFLTDSQLSEIEQGLENE